MNRILSKNKALLLRIFFTNPDRAYYLQEIGRILGKKPGTFQKAINSLEKEGILQSEYKTKVRLFRVNKDYSLYTEFKSIVFKTVGMTETLREGFTRLRGIRAVFIYGSFAKGEEIAESDIDIFILGKPNRDRLIDTVKKIERKLCREINYNVYNQEDFSRKIKEKDPFITDLLRNPIVFIIGDENVLK